MVSGPVVRLGVPPHPQDPGPRGLVAPSGALSVEAHNPARHLGADLRGKLAGLGPIVAEVDAGVLGESRSVFSWRASADAIPPPHREFDVQSAGSRRRTG